MATPQPEDPHQIADGVRVLLKQWDPIDVVAGGGPTDEYECLVWPIVRLLREGVSAEGLADYLTKELRDHFGLNPEECAPSGFAKRATGWFEAERRT